MAEVARRRRLAAAVKLPSSTTVRSTKSWSTLGVPGGRISNLLKRTFSFIRILWIERSPMFPGNGRPHRQTSIAFVRPDGDNHTELASWTRSRNRENKTARTVAQYTGRTTSSDGKLAK